MIASVIIPTHNRADKLRQTLEELANQSFSGSWEVVVVDNNCTDATVEVVSAAAQNVRLITEHKPGPSAARNAGARAATGQYMILIDDDILVDERFVEAHVDALTSHEGRWIVGQVQQHPRFLATAFGRFRDRLYPVMDPTREPLDIEWFASGNASLPREDLLALGGYNEEFTTAALEDADLVVRAHRAGHQMLYVPSIIALHNDWAGASIRDYCERQRVHCQSAVILERRFGAENPRSGIVRRNAPASVTDPLHLFPKSAKSMVSSDAGSAVAFGIVAFLERLGAPARVLDPIYRALVASWMFRGVGEGLSSVPRLNAD